MPFAAIVRIRIWPSSGGARGGHGVVLEHADLFSRTVLRFPTSVPSK
jgi:hypothetical protein